MGGGRGKGGGTGRGGPIAMKGRRYFMEVVRHAE